MIDSNKLIKHCKNFCVHAVRKTKLKIEKFEISIVSEVLIF